MQTETLSQDQLEGLMYLLKESLSYFDKECYPKIVFFNDWCMYRHIRTFDIPLMDDKRFNTNIGTLLDVLEPYIPFKLTEENFDMFMESVFLPEEASIQFIHKAKMDFVVAIRAVKNSEQWEQALLVCESIRSLKEELAASQV